MIHYSWEALWARPDVVALCVAAALFSICREGDVALPVDSCRSRSHLRRWECDMRCAATGR
jgi:hypothetical protein